VQPQELTGDSDFGRDEPLREREAGRLRIAEPQPREWRDSVPGRGEVEVLALDLALFDLRRVRGRRYGTATRSMLLATE
jgi:hypothetical protein